MRKVSVGCKLYISIMAVFLLFAVSFIVFQQTREKQYKIEMLNMRLQDYNTRMANAIQYMGKRDEQTLSNYVKTHSIPNLRVTLINDQGQVVFDNFQKKTTAASRIMPTVRKSYRRGRRGRGQARSVTARP